MRTRSQKDTPTPATSTVQEKHGTDELHRRWSSAEIDRIEFDESSETYHFFLEWPDGEVTEHDKEEVREKCKQQVSQNP